MKIGVHIPTHNRPHTLRSAILQIQNQSLKPDIVVIHHNNLKDSYSWVIKDLQTDFELVWIHTPEGVSNTQAYSIPMEYLIQRDCTHYFYCDDDDIYLSEHFKDSIEQMTSGQADYIVRKKCHVLRLLKNKFELVENLSLNDKSHGGQSSSICFNKAFAVELLKDYNKNILSNQYIYADMVIAYETMKKFKCLRLDNVQTIYVAHAGAQTSYSWVAE